jgi:nucleoside-diphosphate-sugar epimerase
MNVILTGGTGFVGSPVLDRLQSSGHQVTALVRSEEAATKVAARGATPMVGNFADQDWLASAFAGGDGAIHAAGTYGSDAALFASGVVHAVVEGLAGTDKPYVHISGDWAYGPGANITEDQPYRSPAQTAWIGGVEDIVLNSPVATSVIVSAVVYGHGGGLPNLVGPMTRNDVGQVPLIGDGDNHWTTVHGDDLASLFVILLERDVPAGHVIAASGANPTVREIGEAAAAPGAGVLPEDPEASRARLGKDLADALMMDQQAFAEKARELGWTPVAPSLVDDVRSGSYAR